MKNSHEYDEILTKILKISTPYILSLLTYACNNVLSTGVFPDRLKYWEIKTLFKKVDKTSIYNYRPISLLISFSKIIVKISYKRLYHHININNILVKEQWWSVL